MSEKLSALIDNELEEFERARILRDLSRSGELAELWSRYHIIGLAMRRERIVPSESLPARVAGELMGDAGGGETAETAASDGRRSWFRPAGGLAVAASIVGVLLLGGLVVQLYQESRPVASDGAGAQQLAVNDDATRWQDVDPATEDALNTFLIEHGEFTSASGMNGLTAYTKFVAYDSR